MGKRKKGNPVNGWIVIDKAIGMNSTPAVGKVRWLFNAQKAGHGGTLDPLASGLLPIALGEATKTVGMIMDGSKSYDFTVKWGEATDSDDSQGEITETSDLRPTAEQIEAILEDYMGEIWQRPPSVSAIKVDGQRAYDLARNGDAQILEKRQVWIADLQLLDSRDGEADFRVDCGKGTYVRSLARDFGEQLGCLGHITRLRRTKVGPFDERDAITLDKLAEIDIITSRFEQLLPLESALDDIPALDVTQAEAQTMRNGQSISLLKKSDLHRLPELDDEDPRLWVRLDGKAVALAVFEAGMVRSLRVINQSDVS